MEVVRADIHAMTASFRYPMFVVSYQPTYSVPPVSTVLGLLSAAKGEIVNPEDIRLGYNFSSEGRGLDLEKIHIFGEKKISYQGSNIVNREFLYGCTLTLYVDDPDFADYLKNPEYNLLLGRQSDLAYVKNIDSVDIHESEKVIIKDTIVPFPSGVSGQVVSLPISFTESASRKPRDVRNFCIVETKQTIEKAYLDSERDRGVYMHDFSS